MAIASLAELADKQPKPDKEYVLKTIYHQDIELFLKHRPDMRQLLTLSIKALQSLDIQPSLVIVTGSRVKGTHTYNTVPKDVTTDLDLLVLWPNEWIPPDVSRGDQQSELSRINNTVNQSIRQNFSPDNYYPSPPRVHITAIAQTQSKNSRKILNAIASGIVVCGQTQNWITTLQETYRTQSSNND
ncbi:hypothetical protein ACFLY9_02260 [Patescibacteria group bacterium]